MLDGDFLPNVFPGGAKLPLGSIARQFHLGMGNHVPTIISTAAEESDRMAGMAAVPLTAKALRERVVASFKWRWTGAQASLTEKHVDKLLTMPWYKLGRVDDGLPITPQRAWARIVTDLHLRCPAGTIAGDMVAGWPDVTVYNLVVNQVSPSGPTFGSTSKINPGPPAHPTLPAALVPNCIVHCRALRPPMHGTCNCSLGQLFH